MTEGPLPRSERTIVGIVAVVQFVNVLDFMMVMPLGPDFARALHIPVSHLGSVGGAYTAAGCVMGILGAFFLDRFARRTALVVSLAGLSAGTLAGALAVDASTLLIARVVAGAFGGPATSLAMSIVADAVPARRRGRAMGVVMGSFSVASVVGVPSGLELARLVSWRGPFLAVAALGVAAAIAARVLLPRLDEHLGAPRAGAAGQPLSLLARREVLLACGIVACANLSAFSFVPNIAALLQQNLGYPREDLAALYMAGGATTFFTLRLAGRIIDRAGSFVVVLVSVSASGSVVLVWAVAQDPAVPVLPLFVTFMVSNSARNVAQQALASKVPDAHERAGFQSLQSSVQHGFAALGAFVGSLVLFDDGERLGGAERLAVFMVVVAMIGVPLVARLERVVRRSGETVPAGVRHEGA